MKDEAAHASPAVTALSELIQNLIGNSFKTSVIISPKNIKKAVRNRLRIWKPETDC